MARIDTEVPGYITALARRAIALFRHANQPLQFMAGLPLVDGVFASALTSGVLADPLTAVAFGLGVFSGSGCITAALSLDGSLARRLAGVLEVYGLFIIPGALMAIVAAPLVGSFVLPEFPAFAALVLVGLALELWGVRVVPDGPPPASTGARWLWGCRLLVMPQVVIPVAVVASALWLIVGAPARVAPASTQLGPIALLAPLAGCAETLLAAALAGTVHRLVDPAWIRRAGALTLGLIALQIVGVPIPTTLPPAMLGLALVAGAVWRSVRTPAMVAAG
jgi:hypothetical protein